MKLSLYVGLIGPCGEKGWGTDRRRIFLHLHSRGEESSTFSSGEIPQ
jgi:hypothetical protein